MKVPFEALVKTLGNNTFDFVDEGMATNIANQIASGGEKIIKVGTNTYVPFHAIERGIISVNSHYNPPKDTTCVEKASDGYSITQDAEGNFFYNGLPYRESGLFGELMSLGENLPDIKLVSAKDPSFDGTYAFDTKGADMGGPYFIYKMGTKSMRISNNGVSLQESN